MISIRRHNHFFCFFIFTFLFLFLCFDFFRFFLLLLPLLLLLLRFLFFVFLFSFALLSLLLSSSLSLFDVSLLVIMVESCPGPGPCPCSERIICFNKAFFSFVDNEAIKSVSVGLNTGNKQINEGEEEKINHFIDLPSVISASSSISKWSRPQCPSVWSSLPFMT